MFKKSRKAKGQEDALGALTSSTPEPTPMIKAHRALTRKKKKEPEIEQTPIFDLSSALPDSNEFRTSLLMPNLSARFSMLREQDDPNTLIGKASDDSVLFPKRASRLNLFNSNIALTDIAEVESIRSSFRPPFADGRTNSSSDGYASDDGGSSMMNRARPGEGNNLFGGRQKLYKISTNSSKTLPSEGGMTRGKHTYEPDVALSAFQQIKIREKEQREADEADRHSFPNTELEEQDSTRSPLTAFSQNRGTQSSTHSGPSNRRTSTAATSVVSDSPVPQRSSNSAINKVKEQDANSSAESIGLASSPSLRKIQEDSGRPPYQFGQTRSAANLKDNQSRQSPVTIPQAFRAMSPSVSATNQPLDFGLKETSKTQPIPSRFRTASPTAAFDFEQDETLASNIRPNDRGKATAMGLFNKPARNYDDTQFQQRQVQMHEGRDTPSSTSNSRAASRASPDLIRSNRPSFASVHSSVPQDGTYTPQIPPIPNYSPSPSQGHRFSASSTGRRSTSRSRTKSSASNKEAAVQARVQSLIRRQNAELAALEANHLGPTRSLDDDESVDGRSIAPTSPEKEDDQQPILENGDRRGSESKGRRLSTKSAVSMASVIPPPPILPTEIHPALRDGIQDFDFGTTESRKSSFPRYSNHSETSKMLLSTERGRQSRHGSMVSTDDRDSVNAPTAGLGLSGLIRTHLRHDSDRSSMPPPSPAMPSESFRESVSSTTRTVTESVKSDPFEYDNDTLNVPLSAPQEQPPLTPTTAMSQRAAMMLANAAAIRDAQAQNQTPRAGFSNGESSDEHNEDRPQTDTSNHSRNESTETQREQQRFDEELAERRRRVQEGLKSVQEQSRSRSPSNDRNKANGFTLPRFPSRSNTGDKYEQQSQNKAMKMLGITSAARDQPSPRIPGEPFQMDGDRPRKLSSRQGHRPDEYSSGRHTPTSGRLRNVTGNGQDRPIPPRSTTPNSRPTGRGRSNSAAANRSDSRAKSIPDSDRAMMPGAFPASPFLLEQNDHGHRSESPIEFRSYERSVSSAAGNYQDRQTYFDSKSLAAPGMNGDFTPRPSPRPSPIPGESTFAAQMSAPPMSPTSAAMPSPGLVSGRSTPSRDRKRSVTKHMISEPTFVSSTSTVPLVYLPRDGGPPVEPVTAPPLPTMNPRRRGNTGDGPQFGALRAMPSPLPVVPASPVVEEFQIPPVQPTPPPPRSRNRLRKSSSEGGNMAARAKHQAILAEMAVEKERSPNVAVFPNKSAVSLRMNSHDGGMF